MFLGYENDNVLEQFRYVWFEYHVKNGLSTVFYRTFQSFSAFLLFSFHGFIIFMRNRHSIKPSQTEKFLILIGWGIFLLPSILIATDTDRMIISFFPVFLFFSLFCIKEQEYYQSPIFWILFSIRFVNFYLISRISFTIFPILSIPINQLYLLETILFILLFVLSVIMNVTLFLSPWKFRNRIFNKIISDLLNYNSRNTLNRLVKVFDLFKNELISHGTKLKKPEKKDFRKKPLKFERCWSPKYSIKSKCLNLDCCRVIEKKLKNKVIPIPNESIIILRIDNMLIFLKKVLK